MRIALVIGRRADGGTYQYGQMVAAALASYVARSGDDVLVVPTWDEAPDLPGTPGWPVELLAAGPTVQRLAQKALASVPGHLRLISAGRRLSGRLRAPSQPIATVDPTLNRWFTRRGIDLAIYPAPTELAFQAGIPYVAAVHDLQHRIQPEFPEVSAGGAFEGREFLFSNLIRRALRTLADSECGAEDIVRLYELDTTAAARVSIVPYTLPPGVASVPDEAEIARVRASYSLPERYLFYPAQFWPHKNHARLVQALAQLGGDAADVPLVLIGSRSGDLREATFAAVMSLAEQLGVSARVRYLGYVPDSDIAPLYAGAQALVMPTFFGPTNIPSIEAWHFGCPVITSDVRGIPEQVGDAAVLVTPSSVESIAAGIERVLSDGALRDTLVKNGRRRIAGYPQVEFARRFGVALDEAKAALHAATSSGVAA